MNFTEIAVARQSCRSYDPTRAVEPEKLARILESARLAPSACNGQPYRITVCEGEAAAQVAKATQGMGLNKFAPDAPILLVISEADYVPTAALGAKVKKNDDRSMDIGILAAYITAEATAQGLRMIKEVGLTSDVLTLRSFEAFEKAADGKATKIIIPSEIQGLAGLASALTEATRTDN